MTRIDRARRRALAALSFVAAGGAVALLVSQAIWLARGPSFAADHGLETMVEWAGSDSRRFFECLIERIERHPRDYRAEGGFELRPIGAAASVTLRDWVRFRADGAHFRLQYAEHGFVIRGFRQNHYVRFDCD